jgi:radical SAM superfamily enzyme YgiQ (UPF0313 family)
MVLLVLEEFVFKYKNKVSLPFACLMFPSASTTNENSISLLKNAGCFYISLGIQCMNQELRSTVLSRAGNNQEIRDAISVIKNSKIFLNLEFMAGIPNQKEEDIIDAEYKEEDDKK